MDVYLPAVLVDRARRFLKRSKALFALAMLVDQRFLASQLAEFATCRFRLHTQQGELEFTRPFRRRGSAHGAKKDVGERGERPVRRELLENVNVVEFQFGIVE